MRAGIVTLPILLLLAPAPVHADDRGAAEQFFRIGAEAYKTGNFDAAAANFDRAYENLKAPEIAFSAAQAHRLQYQADRDPMRVRRAIDLFEAYIAGAPSGAKRKDALAHLERLRDLRSKLDASGVAAVAAKETPSLYVSVPIETALITIDGKPVDRYTAVEVTSGEHVVVVTADGYFPDERKVPVGTGRAMVAIELKPKPAVLSIRSQRDARITIDGRPVLLRGTTTEVPAGTRLVTVAALGRQPISREVQLEPGKTLTLDAPLQPTGQRRAVTWVWVGTGLLAAGALVTTGVALHADFSAADLRDRQPLPALEAADYERLRDRRDRYRTASLVVGGAALVSAGVAMFMYYADNPSTEALLRPVEDSSEGTFTPMAFGDAGGLGLGYAGGF